MITITVEFYGIPRQRAGRTRCEVTLPQDTVETCTLRAVLAQLAMDLPNLAAECITDGRLNAGFTVNLNGEKFTRDCQTEIPPGATLLILSADAGG